MSNLTKKTKENFIPATKQDVPEAIEILKKQLELLKAKAPESVSLDVMYGHSNVKDITSVVELIEIGASIDARSEAYEKQVKKKKLTGKVSEWLQSEKTKEEWEKILDKAIFELINKEEIKKREMAISKLEKHLDDETRLKNDLAEIMNDAIKPLK